MCLYLTQLQPNVLLMLLLSPRLSSMVSTTSDSVLHISGLTVISDTPQPEEAPPPYQQPIDHARSIWTSPFTLPSRIITNTPHSNKRNWSKITQSFGLYLTRLTGYALQFGWHPHHNGHLLLDSRS